MDISKRDLLFENKRQLEKNLKEAFGRMLGVVSAGPIATGPGAAAKNRAALGKKQGLKYPPAAFKEEEELEDVGGEEELDLGIDATPDATGTEMGDTTGGELDVPVDDNADMVDDAAQGEDGASEQKIAADAVAQTYLSQLPSDITIEADDQGIVFAEFHDDIHGPFKVLLFPASMAISEVAEVKEPTNPEAPLGIEDESGEDMEDMDVEGDVPTGDLDMGDTEPTGDLGGEGEEDVEGIEDEEEEPVLQESVRDRRLRKKGLIGNDRDPEAEEAAREEERDPMRAGRKSWQAMMESRRSK